MYNYSINTSFFTVKCYCQFGINEKKDSLKSEKVKSENKRSGLKNAVYYYKLGKDYDSIKDYTNAIKYYSIAIEFDKDFSDAIARRGNCYYEKDDYDNALIDFNKAIELKKPTQSTRIYTLRAFIYLTKQKNELALQDLNKSIEIKPDDYEAYMLRGVLLNQMNHKDEACKDFIKANELGCNEAIDKIKRYCH